MKLSNKKLKYIRRHADSDSPQEIADALRIPVKEVETVLREEGFISSPLVAPGGGNLLMPILFAAFVAIAPFVMTREVAEATKTPQNAYIQIGAVAFLLAILHLYGQRQKLQLGPRVLGIATVAFLVWCTLSFAWAMSVREGIERILTYGGIAVVYVVTLNIVRRESLLILLASIFGSAVVCACIGLGQYYWSWDVVLQTAKPASMFVNKNMACHFMVLSVPLGLYLFLRVKELWQQALVGIGAALILAYVFHTYTKGAWLALTVETIAMGVLLVVVLLRERGREAGESLLAGLNWLFSGIVVVLSIGLLAVLICLTPKGFQNEFKVAIDMVRGTITEQESFIQEEETPVTESVAKQVERGEKTMETSSLAVRKIVWNNTLEMWKDHFLFGVGMGNFRANYDPYARSAVVDTFWPANEWHRTHNDYLQTAVETGLVGALLLLTIIGSLVWIAVQALRSEMPLAAVALLVALIGLSVSSFFSFPFERTIPPLLFAVYAGVLTLLARERVKVRSAKLNVGSWYGLLGASYAVLLILTWAHIKLIRSDAYARQVYNAESSENFGGVIAYGNKVMEVDPSRVRILCRMGRAYTDLGQTQKSIEVLTKVIDVFPTWYLALHNLGVAYQRHRVPDKAYHYAERALELHPKAAESMNVIGCAKLDEANIVKGAVADGTPEEKQAAEAKATELYKEAEAIFQKAMDLDPENHEYVYNKGLATYWQGKLKDAMQLMALAIELEPTYALPYKDLGAMYASDLKQPVKACEMFYKALQHDPQIDGASDLRNFLRQRGVTPPGEQAAKQETPRQPRLPGPAGN